jgi:RNA polymerase sigma-70 factor, ECF subfamily
MADPLQTNRAVPLSNSADEAVLLTAGTGGEAAADRDLVSAVRAGSSDAFQKLHSTYSKRLYRTILNITKNPQDAEDALQNAFLRAHLAIHTFAGRSTLYSWLTRIAINSALMILRKQRSRPEVLFDPEPDPQQANLSFEVRDFAPNPEEAYDMDQRQRRTLRAIRHLDPDLREPLWMRSAHGSSVKEISRALNISEAAVKARIHRARRRLSAIRASNLSICTGNGAVFGAPGKRQSPSAL